MQEKEVDSVAEFHALQDKAKEALDSLLVQLGDPDWIVFCGCSIPGRFKQEDGTYKLTGDLHVHLSICHQCAPEKLPSIPATWHDVRVRATTSQYLCEPHKAG